MRYIVSFYDRSARRVDEAAAQVFKRAMETKSPVDYKGCRYAGSSIVSVKPMHAHEQELREEAQASGLFRCRYGQVHPSRRDCACKDAGFRHVLEAEEERLLLEEGSRAALPPPSVAAQNAKTLGFADAKALHEAPSWTKAGAIVQVPKKA